MPLSAKRILVAPLDWGLGHTTRCVPIIKCLRQFGHTVVFAGNDIQQAIVGGQFPDLALHPLMGYDVRYGRQALILHILRQVPGLFHRIREEHRWLANFVEREHIDAIISDNRYGLWHPEKPSVILTHQLNILTGLGSLADAPVRRLHYSFLQRFGSVWIPDLPGPENLGGRLSHPKKLPLQARYIGWLSQLEPVRQPLKQQHLLILLSGPEPQRSLLSEQLWYQACILDVPIVFVEGKEGFTRAAPAHIQHYALADAGQIQAFIRDAALVVCRSGYSTLMDLAPFGKPAILIPTPGQTEQAYLAKALSKRGLFYEASQRNLDLKKLLAKARLKPLLQPTGLPSDNTLLEPAVQDWLARL
ncbi:MAG: glycosyl transferase family 28 [Bacteroidetes bacterium]|nr:glycosyl transferase family 28 [Bacteroidota bacterium]MBS1628571.1 glycosyl transferase family 28 [Bacteroidota bacterium]